MLQYYNEPFGDITPSPSDRSENDKTMYLDIRHGECPHCIFLRNVFFLKLLSLSTRFTVTFSFG